MVCSHPKSALDVPDTPDPRTLLGSPTCPPGREQLVRDDLASGTWTVSSSIPRMRPPTTGPASAHRLATQRPSGLQHAFRRTLAVGTEIWRGMLHRTVVGLGRPTTTQCRDFTLSRSADWMQLT
jgi:hypothetical protein